MGQLLALNTRGSVDPRWLSHNSGVLRALQLASIEIYRAPSNAQTYNATTNTWTSSSTELFVGKARIQPVSGANEVATSINPTAIQTVLVQISKHKNESETAGTEIPDLRPNDRLKVLSSPSNNQLEKYIFVVNRVLNSSNAWEISLECKVDIELDPTVTNG